MAEILVLIVLLLSVGFLLWRYENSSPIVFEETQILEKRIVPSYDPFIYAPLIHPRMPPLSSEVKERFFLRFKLEEIGAINIEVAQRIFEEAEEGKLVVVMYQVGRITRQIRVIDLC